MDYRLVPNKIWTHVLYRNHGSQCSPFNRMLFKPMCKTNCTGMWSCDTLLNLHSPPYLRYRTYVTCRISIRSGYRNMYAEPQNSKKFVVGNSWMYNRHYVGLLLYGSPNGFEFTLKPLVKVATFFTLFDWAEYLMSKLNKLIINLQNMVLNMSP